MLRDGEVVMSGGQWRTESEARKYTDSMERHLAKDDGQTYTYEVFSETDGIEDWDWARRIIEGFLAAHEMWVTPPEDLVEQARQYLKETP
jgi:hypothetical protein